MTLELQASNGKLTGTWNCRNKQVVQFTASKDTASWKIEKTSTDNDKNACFRLNTLTCKLNKQYDKTYITGNLERFIRKDNEPLRPTYFVLNKENAGNTSIAQDTTFIVNRIYPNPMTNQLKIDFTVKRPDEITFQVQNQAGISYFSMKPIPYQPGVYSIIIYPSLPAGSYNFVAFGKQYKLTQTIIKK